MFMREVLRRADEGNALSVESQEYWAMLLVPSRLITDITICGTSDENGTEEQFAFVND